MNPLTNALVFIGHLISWGILFGVPLAATCWLLLGLFGARPPYAMWDILAAILIVVFLYAALSILADKNSTEPPLPPGGPVR